MPKTNSKPGHTGGKKAAKTTSKKLSHRSPAAAAKRAENDEKIRALLQRPEAKDGFKRERLVELSRLPPNEVKAALNRLVEKNQCVSVGRTIDTKYFPPAKSKRSAAPAKIQTKTTTLRPGMKKGADEES